MANRRVLGVFVLAMINVALIASLRGLPVMAGYGLSSVFFYVFAALVFLIPTALVSAELATGWPREGGVYLWVKEAFGNRFGFLSIWLQWIQNVIWYPTVLAFTAATFAFIFNPALANNKFYAVFVILAVYWGGTLLNFLGMKTSGWVSTVGVISGTIVPGLLVIILGLVWILKGEPSQITFSARNMMPDLHLANIVFAVNTFLAYAGMEVSAVHASEVKNPQRDYPKAIFLSVAIILVVFILGTLAVAAVVPAQQISLVAGLMQAFTVFLDAYHLRWAVPIVAALITIGAIGQVTSWIAGPSKGLLATSRHGNLPPFFKKTNKNGMPVNILIVQAIIVTILSLVFLLMPTVSSSYWILTALTTQLYLIMYVLMFAAAIRLRYLRPKVKRAYCVPGGNVGMWIVAGIGAIAALAAIIVGFVPPAHFATGSKLFYHSFLILGLAIMLGIPLIIQEFKKPSWGRGG